MQKKETAIEVKVGALVLFSSALLVAFVLLLGDFSFSKGFEFDVEFSNAGGLKPGAEVAIAGIAVGNVKQLRFTQNENRFPNANSVAVRATLRVDEQYAQSIRQDSQFFITTRGVLGEPYIEVVTKNFEAPAVKKGDVLVGVDPPRLDIIIARATELITSLNELFDDPNIQTRELITNTASLMKSLDGLVTDNREELDDTVKHIRTTSEEASKLLTALNVAVEDGSELRGTVANLNATARSARNIAGKVDNKLDPMLNDLTVTASNARELTESADRLITKNEDKINSSIDNLSVSSERLASMSKDAEEVVQGIKKGEGTVGALLSERELYDDLKEMLRNIKQRPWKIVWKE